MAYKLDTTRPIFLGANPARQGTVVDAIRKAVAELDSGEGVSYETLETYLLQNYTPAKSQNYNASFVKSYVRDALGKYGFLGHENEGYGYSFIETAAPKDPRPKRVSKAAQEVLEVASFILNAGEVSSEEDVVNTCITPDDIAQELGRRRSWVDKRVEDGISRGILRLAEEDGRNVVYLTPEGFTAASGGESPPEAQAESSEELESA